MHANGVFTDDGTEALPIRQKTPHTIVVGLILTLFSATSIDDISMCPYNTGNKCIIREENWGNEVYA